MAGRSPRTLRTTPVANSTLVASSVGFPGDVAQQPAKQVLGWQQEAWRQYSICPELAFAAGWIGNALSRCVLNPGQLDAKGVVSPASDGAILNATVELWGVGTDQQAEILRCFGIHLTVAGEGYLVGWTPRETDGAVKLDPYGQPYAKRWDVVGVTEMVSVGKGWGIRSGTGPSVQTQTLHAEDDIIRIWRPDPARRMEAWSPVKALLGTLAEIELASGHIHRQMTSRLAGAGVFFIPNSIEFSGASENDNKATSFQKVLGKDMMSTLDNPAAISAHVPTIASVPPETMQYIKEPIHFWSAFDEKVSQNRKDAVMRFCVGMDIPPEVIQGMTHGASSSGGKGTGASHWTSWQIEEAAIKLHIEPLLGIIAVAIVKDYLRPRAKNPRATLIPDSTALKLQPDRSKEALELYDRGRLNDAALMRYTGFAPGDLPTDQEYQRWLAAKLAVGTPTPDQIAWAADYLGLGGVPEGGTVQPERTDQAPSLEDHPAGRSKPEQASINKALLLCAASEPLVLRALEKAGNRLRTRGCRPEGIPPHEVYLYAESTLGAPDLLDGAWTMVATVADGLTEASGLERALNAYVENLLAERIPHSRAALMRYLTLVPEGQAA